MGKLFKLIILVAIAGAAYAWLSPFLAVKNLTRALENEDPQTVDRYVDFDAVKVSFQDDFAKRMNLDTSGSGFASALATSIAGAFISGIVSPDTMVSVLKDKDRRDSMGLTDDLGTLVSRGSWVDADTFVLHNDDGKPTALLTRKGAQWEVTALRIN